MVMIQIIAAPVQWLLQVGKVSLNYEDLSPSCAQCEDDGGSNDELDGDFFEDNLTSNDTLNEGIKRDL